MFELSIPLARKPPDMELTKSFDVLLQTFAPVFTSPSFASFRLLMTGWIISTRHRYVTDLIVSSNSVGNGHFSDFTVRGKVCLKVHSLCAASQTGHS